MTNYESMWKLLENYQFEFNSEMIKHFTCAICHKLLNNAYEGVCGCVYCKECIGRYLTEANPRICPGNNCEYDTNRLDLDNIKISNAINRQISQLQTNCPVDNCTWKCALSQMENHLKVCDKQLEFCPYDNIGCVSGNRMERANISQHILSDLNSHMAMLIVWVSNIKNELLAEINSPDNQLQSITTAFESIMTQLADRIETYKRQNSELLDDFFKKFNELTSENNRLNELIRNCDQTFEWKIILFKNEIDKVRMEIAELRNSREKFRENDLESLNLPLTPLEIDQSENSDDNRLIASITWFAEAISIGIFSKYSENFLSVDGRYVIRLQMKEGGCNNCQVNNPICIIFSIVDKISDENGENLGIWPLTCTITMTMRSDLTENGNRVCFQEKFIFHEPYVYKWSDLTKLAFQSIFRIRSIPVFHFPKSYVVKDECSYVECVVEMDE